MQQVLQGVPGRDGNEAADHSTTSHTNTVEYEMLCNGTLQQKEGVKRITCFHERQ